MSNLKPCPFCGSEAIVPAMPIGITDDDTPVECTNMDCNASDVTFDKKEWNTRPIEDALRKEIAQLQADNRSLVEQINEMALKPNQEVIEWHEYDHDNPETYPEKRGFYLCESASGKIELFWSPLAQEWYITEVHDKVYNHFQINAYYTWVKAPKGVKHENTKLL